MDCSSGAIKSNSVTVNKADAYLFVCSSQPHRRTNFVRWLEFNLGVRAMTVTTAKWTLDDYHRMIEVGLLVGRNVELLNGEIIEMPPEGPEHAQQSTDAADYLKELLPDLAIVRDAKPITLPETGSEPQPDLAIVQPLRTLYRTRHPYPENIFWLIEFSQTTLAKDLEVKHKTYAAALIQEYWVVDLKNQQLKVFRDPVDGDYRLEQTLTSGEICAIAFPHLPISIEQLIN
ncbi:Uma2 family endonuclease [Floridanema aerugineum]|uniref:Uma2 family endonuclease n=1 Tax=Floridaenema aerugineum BLCC-F46 TaxID=3153654 RepID=A0ABV4X959_9CYAN